MPPILQPQPLAATGLKASRLGLSGSWNIDAASVERAFYELGINHFFFSSRMTAMVEGIRRLIRAGHRDELVLHSSGAYWPTAGGVRRTWEKHARALGVDTLDLFMVAAVRARWFVGGGTWPQMQRLKQEGKVRAITFSCHNRPLARQLVDELAPDAIMIRYNAAHPGAETEIFTSLGAARPAVIAFTATSWGRLLQPVGDRQPMTPAECYRFQLGHPAVDVGLCGAASYEELRQDVEAVVQGPLGPEDLARVRAFGRAVHATVRGKIF